MFCCITRHVISPFITYIYVKQMIWVMSFAEECFVRQVRIRASRVVRYRFSKAFNSSACFQQEAFILGFNSINMRIRKRLYHRSFRFHLVV